MGVKNLFFFRGVVVQLPRRAGLALQLLVAPPEVGPALVPLPPAAVAVLRGEREPDLTLFSS
jgi:hypothetical protein